MKRLATALVALSVLAVATPSLARHHEETANKAAEVKAEAKAAAPKKHKVRKHRMHRNAGYDMRDARHTYPGSSYSYANRHENGVGIGGAVVKH